MLEPLMDMVILATAAYLAYRFTPRNLLAPIRVHKKPAAGRNRQP